MARTPQPGAARQQRRDQVRHGVDQVLAVVDQQQALPAAEPVDEYVQFAALGPHPGLEDRAAAQPDRGEHGRADLGRLGDRGEVDHPGAVAVLVAVAAAGLDGEPGLAGAAGTDHGDQAPARRAARRSGRGRRRAR